MPVQRSTVACRFENHCDQFLVKERSFERQYFHYYNARYNQMYEWTKRVALDKWGTDIKLIKLCDLMEHQEKRVCIIGTLLKKMKQQPSVLADVSDNGLLVKSQDSQNYCSDEDFLSLQDDTESVTLQGGDIDVAEMVTGVVVAVIGQETDNGNRFIVESHCFPTFPPQNSPKLPEEDKYIVLVSGLGICLKPDPKFDQARQIFLDAMAGGLGRECAQISSKIARVIVCGNCIAPNARDQEKEQHREELENSQEWNVLLDRCFTIDTAKVVDDFLLKLSASVPVEVMPGPLDITSHLLPQQPMHPCVFPRSSRTKRVYCRTNPYSASFDGVRFLGTSGRVITSIREMSRYADPIDILERTLHWRHIVPTAPDTAYCFPFQEQDPFVLNECPDVYFAANQETFNTRMFKGPNGQSVRLISVPNFEQTRTCVLVNLRNLECQLMAFD